MQLRNRYERKQEPRLYQAPPTTITPSKVSNPKKIDGRELEIKA